MVSRVIASCGQSYDLKAHKLCYENTSRKTRKLRKAIVCLQLLMQKKVSMEIKKQKSGHEKKNGLDMLRQKCVMDDYFGLFT
jgi:hypothetical protein